MVFHRARRETSNLNIVSNNNHVKRVDLIKFLGVIIDENLRKHIEYTNTKICKSIAIICTATKKYECNLSWTIISYVYGEDIK